MEEQPLGNGRKVRSGSESTEFRICEPVWETIYTLISAACKCHSSFSCTVMMGQALGLSDLQHPSIPHPTAAAAGVPMRSLRSGALIRHPPNLV